MKLWKLLVLAILGYVCAMLSGCGSMRYQIISQNDTKPQHQIVWEVVELDFTGSRELREYNLIQKQLDNIQQKLEARR